MSSPESIIQVDQVSLRYRLAKQRIPSLKEYAIHFLRGVLSYEELWALKDLSFSVARGESLGIVGRNGAGKSTLLKVISGVLKPTLGSCKVKGVVAPILELGTGFDTELTGVENIYLSSLLLGRRRAEIDQKIESIVAFSGLEDFIYSPVRNYSSGMLARLGFSIVTAWVPDVLILDEIFAVGDSRFVEKCEVRLREYHDQGTALLLVSHAPDAILKNCQRCLWIESGQLIADGEPEDVLERYERRTETAPEDSAVTDPEGVLEVDGVEGADGTDQTASTEALHQGPTEP